MKKRALSAILWVYVAWYASNTFGLFAGLALPGAVIGLAVGAMVIALPIVRAQRVAAEAQAGGQVAVLSEG